MSGEATSGTAEIVLDLPGFVVIAAAEYGGELEVLVETTAVRVDCGSCGRRASSHGRREHLLRDVPTAGRPALLVWRKRIWRCRNVDCATVTWTEQAPTAAPRSSLTQRAKQYVTRRVGADGESVAAMARTLGTGWRTIMRAVVEVGTPMIADTQRLAAVSGLGVDEHAWQHPNRRRGTGWATGIVDLTPGRAARLLEVTPGRSGASYAGWLCQRDRCWREQIRIAALDPFRGYLAAARTHLPEATHVLDAFHVTRLGMQALDEVRRRVQQQTLARRGHKGDPLYETRRVLRRRADRLSPRALARVQTALRRGDPDGEVTAAWWAAQQICLAYAKPDPVDGRAHAEQLIPTLLDCPVPEVARLGRTLRSWRREYLAYFDTGRASNGPTEAINLLIEKVRRVGHGYRNWHNYRLRLLLHCGVTWTNPLTPRIRRRRPRFVT